MSRTVRVCKISVLVFIEYNAYMSWVLAYCHNCNCDWLLLFHHSPSWSSLSSFSWRFPTRKNNLQASTVHTCLCCLCTQVRMHCISLCPCGLTQVVLLPTCTSVTDCTQTFLFALDIFLTFVHCPWMWPVTSHVIMKIKINTLETLPSCVYGSVDLYELNSYITTETDECHALCLVCQLDHSHLMATIHIE